MHFSCKCGYIIHDNTDRESFKASFISDEDMDEFSDIVTAADNAPTAESEFGHRSSDTYFKLTELIDRNIYQCPECGRIFIDDPDDPRGFLCFAPEGKTNTELFISSHRNTGYITADWWDEIRYPDKYNGSLYISCSIRTGDTPSWLYFDRQEDMESRYHELVNKYQEKNLRWSSLRINGKEIHSFKKRD